MESMRCKLPSQCDSGSPSSSRPPTRAGRHHQRRDFGKFPQVQGDGLGVVVQAQHTIVAPAHRDRTVLVRQTLVDALGQPAGRHLAHPRRRLHLEMTALQVDEFGPGELRAHQRLVEHPGDRIVVADHRTFGHGLDQDLGQHGGGNLGILELAAELVLPERHAGRDHDHRQRRRVEQEHPSTQRAGQQPCEWIEWHRRSAAQRSAAGAVR
jgi:hypothetical protein